MGACRAISLAGIFSMLAIGPARAQEEPEGQREPGEPGEAQGSQPDEPNEQQRPRPDEPGNAVTAVERRVLDDMTETRGRPWTEGVPLDRRQRAYELFLEGNNDIREGLFGQAVGKYKEALALWEHPAFHYNLGIAQMNLDQPIDAHDHFLAARKHGPKPITDEKHRLAQNYLNMLRKQLGEIEIVCDEPGAEVALDGKPIFSGPGRQRVMVRPGGHRVEASKRLFMPGVQRVVMNPGDRKRVTVTPQLPGHLAMTRRWDVWKPWAVVGAGVFVLAAGSAAHVQSDSSFLDHDRKFDKICPSGCTDEQNRSLAGQRRSAERMQHAAVTSYIVGGTAAAAGLFLVFMNRPELVSRDVEGDDDEGKLTFAPVITHDSAGVSATFRF